MTAADRCLRDSLKSDFDACSFQPYNSLREATQVYLASRPSVAAREITPLDQVRDDLERLRRSNDDVARSAASPHGEETAALREALRGQVIAPTGGYGRCLAAEVERLKRDAARYDWLRGRLAAGEQIQSLTKD